MKGGAVLLRHFLSLPKGALPGLQVSNFLCNPTPLVLIWRNKGRLNYSNLNEAPPQLSMADPPCGNGEHLRTQVGGGACFVLAGRLHGHQVFLKSGAEARLLMSVKEADIETEAQITPKGVCPVYFFRCKCLFNYVNYYVKTS